MKKKLWFVMVLSIACNFAVSSQSFYPSKYLEELDEAYTSGLFRGWNANFLVPMDEPAASASVNVFQYLQGRVAGLVISGSNSNYRKPYISYRSGQPALYLDEMRVDSKLLASVSMSDIAFIKVFRGPFMGDTGGGSGAIAVYTKEGDEQ